MHGIASSLRLAFQRRSAGKTAQSGCRTTRALVNVCLCATLTNLNEPGFGLENNNCNPGSPGQGISSQVWNQHCIVSRGRSLVSLALKPPIWHYALQGPSPEQSNRMERTEHGGDNLPKTDQNGSSAHRKSPFGFWPPPPKAGSQKVKKRHRLLLV